MAKSYIDELLNDPSKDKNDLYAWYENIISLLVGMHNALADENETLDAIMDANGNNPEEHHAKTMVFYGRKLSIRDVFRGVTSADPSHGDPLNVGLFTGLNQIISQYDCGRLEITWDCLKDETGTALTIYKSDGIPSAPDAGNYVGGVLTQKHMLGSLVQMPTIQNMNNDGVGAGTNTYKVKSGYTITGWKLIQPASSTDPKSVNLYTDDGNDYLKDSSDSPIQDKRVFSFASNVYKIPFKDSILPPTNLAAKKISFVLDYKAIWFNVEFIVRHGTPDPNAPCNTPIRTTIGQTITLPLTTLITPDTGYKVKVSPDHPYGQWTIIDPSTGTDPVDEDGDPIPDPTKLFDAGSSFVVGTTDFDAGIRKMYLVMESLSPT